MPNDPRLQVALEAAQTGLWEWDPVTGDIWWDAVNAVLFGEAPAEVVRSLEEVGHRVHPDDLLPLTHALEDAVGHDTVLDLEFRVTWPDGTQRWLAARGRTVDRGDAGSRVIGTTVDVTEEHRARLERADDAARMARLVAVAQALGEAHTERDVLEVVSRLGTSVLGAQGAGLALPSADRTVVRVLTTAFLDDELQADLAELPADLGLPIVRSAVTGTAYFLPDRAAAEALHPGAGELYARARTEGSAEVPLRANGAVLGTLSVAFAHPHAWRPEDRALVEALAVLTAQALDRIRARRAEREAAAAVRALSEALQRGLLSEPVQSPDLQVAVRYQPAVQQAQVGGDWYDAFVTPDGATTLVVGDVAGHDRHAAAAMAQVRNLLRGVAQQVPHAPAAVLSALDRALHGLRVDSLATAVVCQVRGAGPVARTLHWSNAGHPPPLLLLPDGTALLLDSEPDLLLGLAEAAARADHSVALPPGASVVLYTDGLVERREESLDAGLERLRTAAAGLHALPPEELCDALLARLARGAHDDVALLVLHLTANSGSAQITLPATAGSPGAARAFVLGSTCARQVPDLLDDALLLVSELVTNAVRHGAGPVVVRVAPAGRTGPDGGPTGLSVAVRDAGPEVPVQREPDLLDEGGRGIAMVRMLASAWGVVPERAGGRPAGKTVWFELGT